ncbi:MAG: integral rane sensor signal transduction histidine kinase [Crocinitomicaceae bacterium]|jgi:signal transduction histidine kinase|nr:integral rane sensor signal transduction histidine kinase [Crocinitomicaceae bacterium]
MLRLFTLLFTVFHFFTVIPQNETGKPGLKDRVVPSGKLDKKEFKSEKPAFELLPNKNYSFSQVLHDKSLAFQKTDTLHTSTHQSYWCRFEVTPPGDGGEDFYVDFSPCPRLTLYYFDHVNNSWVTIENGMKSTSKTRNYKLRCRLKRGEKNTVYLKIDLEGFGEKNDFFLGALYVNPAERIDEKESFLFISFLITLAIILVNFIVISIDYIILRDKTHLYFLLLLLSFGIYITGFHKFFNIMTGFRIFKAHIVSADRYFFIELNDVIVSCSLLLIITAYYKLAKTMLDTQNELKKGYLFVKAAIWCFFALYAISFGFSFWTDFYFHTTGLFLANIVLIIIIASIFILGIRSLKYKRKNARLFLISNSLPFLIIIFSAVYLSIYNYNSSQMMLLPYLGILFFTFAFTIALSIRNSYIRIDLNNQEIVAKTLEIENEKIRIQNEYVTLKNKEAERFNALNQKIFSVISHDFKGPIVTLKSLLNKSELISKDNPMVDMYIRDIYSQLNQSDEILESLLDWAKAELSITLTDNRQAAILPLVHKIRQQLDAKLKEKSLELSCDIDEKAVIDLPGEVFTIVLRNLVSNAIKFSHEGGHIKIAHENDKLHVSDSGKGIDPQKLALLFQKQVAPGLGTKFESGFGLGLYLCNELLQKNEAGLSAENMASGGARFTIHAESVKTAIA